jgi:hypothetical protein
MEDEIPLEETDVGVIRLSTGPKEFENIWCGSPMRNNGENE